MPGVFGRIRSENFFAEPGERSRQTRGASQGRSYANSRVCRAPAAGFLRAEIDHGHDLRSMERTSLHPACHCPLHVFSRSDGRSSVKAAAYAARTKMTDHRTGLVHNYSRLSGLLREGLVNWNGTAEELWNAAEASETRINARVGRELRPALPAELPLDEQRRLVHGFCCWLHDHHQIAAHWVIHAPNFHDSDAGKRLWAPEMSKAEQKPYEEALFDPEQTNLNFHAHIRWTVRRVDKETGAFGEKTREFDRTDPWELSAEERHEKRKPEKKIVGRDVINNIRSEWERRVNAALERGGSSARIDLRSYSEMAAAGDAPEGLRSQEHVGPERTQKLRTTANPFHEPMVAERNSIVREENQARWDNWFELRRLAREKARLEGESERIARENEDRRRAQDDYDRERLREAKTDEDRAGIVAEASSIDAFNPTCPLDAAMRWAESVGESSDSLKDDDEFDGAVDLEAPFDPYQPPSPGETLRVKRRHRERQRVRGS